MHNKSPLWPAAEQGVRRRTSSILMSKAPTIRRSARLVIVDPKGQMLLFRYHDEHKPPFWSTAGGELLSDEDYRAAAQRELTEETGFDIQIGQFLCAREDVYAVARSVPARWREKYFLVELDRPQPPDRSGWTNEERATIQDWKWWSLSEMRSEPGSFLPEWLPELLETTLATTQVSSNQ